MWLSPRESKERNGLYVLKGQRQTSRFRYTQHYYILIVYTLLVTEPRRHESNTRTEDTSDEEGRCSSRKNQKGMVGGRRDVKKIGKTQSLIPPFQIPIIRHSGHELFSGFYRRTNMCTIHTSILVLLTIAFHPLDSLVCASAQPKFAHMHRAKSLL